MADANIIIKIVDQTRGGMSSVINQVNDLDRGAKNAGTTAADSEGAGNTQNV